MRRTAFLTILCVGVLAGCSARRCRHCHGYCAGHARVEQSLTADSEQNYVAPDPESESRYGHGPNYRWLKGELQKVHVPGGEWKLRYLPLDQEDRWGGSMVLAPDIRLEQFSDGDSVVLEGEVMVGRPTLYLSGPLYRISSVRSTDGAHPGRVAHGIK